MDKFRRFGVYVVPDGPLGDFGRDWLGWDLTAGQLAVQVPVAGLPKPLADIVATPAPYGLHATIKPPFHLAAGQTGAGLRDAVATLANKIAPVPLDGLQLTDLDGFLALTPLGDVTGLNAFAARTVREIDPFRGPAPESELARRRAHGLTPAQEANLVRWGYPYVMEAFGFHMTLTGRLTGPEATQTRAVLEPIVAPFQGPRQIADLALVGQMETGRFKLIQRYPLTG